MTKPTPGPYTIYTANTPDGKHDGYVVMSDTDSANVVMASFFAEGNEEKALANARAWVEGREAMEKLRRMRALYVDKRDDELFSVAIEVKHILDEP